MRTRVKICGVCRVEDALVASQSGADAIGLVLHKPAARNVPLERAREILAALPPFVTPVGLFVDAPAAEVREVADLLGLRHVQLHGDEDADCIAELKEFVVIKAVRVDRGTFRDEMNSWRKAIADGLKNLRGIVLETAASAPGGTGIANDWEFVRECQAAGLFDGTPPLIAAGGLTPENVAAVVREIRPWAVDVSSGVEARKGIKSREKIVAFVEEVGRKGDEASP
jgi:phosphoribosylanthranilate isomerase